MHVCVAGSPLPWNLGTGLQVTPPFPFHNKHSMQTAAYAQDPGDAVALNSLATYYLHKWFPLPMRAPAQGLVEGQARVPVQADGSGRYGGWVCGWGVWVELHACLFFCGGEANGSSRR